MNTFEHGRLEGVSNVLEVKKEKKKRFQSHEIWFLQKSAQFLHKCQCENRIFHTPKVWGKIRTDIAPREREQRVHERHTGVKK